MTRVPRLAVAALVAVAIAVTFALPWRNDAPRSPASQPRQVERDASRNDLDDAAAADTGSREPIARGTVDVLVASATGRALPGATLRFLGRDAVHRTDTDGRTTLEHAAGTVECTHPDHIPRCVDLAARPAGTEVRIELEPGWTSHGRVVDDRGVAIAGARVSVRWSPRAGLRSPSHAAGYVKWTTTRSDGTFELRGLLAAEHVISATKRGWIQASGEQGKEAARSIEIPRRDAVPLEIVLCRVFVAAVHIDTELEPPIAGRLGFVSIDRPTELAALGPPQAVVESDAVATIRTRAAIDGGELVVHVARAKLDRHPDERIGTTAFVDMPGSGLGPGPRDVGYVALSDWRAHDLVRVPGPAVELVRVSVRAPCPIVLTRAEPRHRRLEHRPDLAASGPDGPFVFELAPGRYEAEPIDRGFLTMHRWVERVEIGPRSAELEIGSSWAPFATLTVKIRDPEGRPATSYALKLRHENRRHLLVFGRDKGDEFSLDCEPGEVRFVLMDLANRAIDTRTEIIAAGEDVEVELTLR